MKIEDNTNPTAGIGIDGLSGGGGGTTVDRNKVIYVEGRVGHAAPAFVCSPGRWAVVCSGSGGWSANSKRG